MHGLPEPTGPDWFTDAYHLSPGGKSALGRLESTP